MGVIIKKPIITIGFDKKGNIEFYVNTDKVKTLNGKNLSDLKQAILDSQVMVYGCNNSLNEEILNTTPLFRQYTSETGHELQNVNISDEVFKVVKNLLKEDQIRESIRIINNSTGFGLRRSKLFVDWYRTHIKKYDL